MSDYYSQTIDYGPLFRTTDPVTSKLAGNAAKEWRGKQHQAILEALAQGPAGASGIASRCGLLAHQVNKRIHELAKCGRIVETGRIVTSASGRGEREWDLTHVPR